MRRVLLIDIPVVPVILPDVAQDLVRRKLTAESTLRHVLLPGVICPNTPYSRGLLMIAEGLRQAGFTVEYVVWSDPEDRRRIRELATVASLVGITCMTSGHDVAASVADQVRALNPRACIILGGHHASELGSELLDTVPSIDAVVRGDGVGAMINIAKSAPILHQIPGVCTRRHPDAAVVHEPYCTSPIPAYDLLYRPLHQYSHSLRTYHGCPYGCTFCVEGLTWRRDSFRNLEIVYAELARVLASMPKGTLVHFSDPVFNVDKRRTTELCHWLAERAAGLYLSLDTRADLLSPENIRLLRSGGFRYFRIGFESLVPDLLSSARKGWSPAEALECLRTIRAVAPDVVVHGYWITGLAGSTDETMRQSLSDARMLLDNGLIDVLSNKVLVPYPGTFYHSRGHEVGVRLLDRPWAAYDRLSPPVYDLDNLSSREIYKWFCETERAAEQCLSRRLSLLRESTRVAAVETYKAIAYMGAHNQEADEPVPEYLPATAQTPLRTHSAALGGPT